VYGLQLFSLEYNYSIKCVVWPKKTGHAQTGVSILTGINLQFSCIYRSVIFYLKNTKFVVEVPAYNRKLHAKFEVNHASRFRDMSDQSFSFCSSFLFLLPFAQTQKPGIHTPIELKFGTRAGQSKVNISAKFCEVPTKIVVVINDYLRKQRSIC